MSSDTFYIELRSLDGDTAELLCTTSTAGGVNDYAATRSFALMALADGMGYGARTPLQQGVAAAGGQVWAQKFHEDNVGTFIAGAELVRRIGVVRDERAWSEGRHASGDRADEVNFPLHKFVLRVRVTDPKYFEGLTVGSRWGTTAFDAWWNDPTRQSRAQLDAVPRTYWSARPKAAKAGEAAGSKAAAKKTGKKAAAKKTAKAVGKKAAKAAVKTTKVAGKKTAKAAAKKLAKAAGKKTAKAAAKKTTKAAGKKTTKAAVKKTTKAAVKKTTKAAVKKTTKTAVKKATKAAVKKATKAAAKKTTKAAAKKAAAKKTAKAAGKKTAKKTAGKKTAKKKTAKRG